MPDTNIPDPDDFEEDFAQRATEVREQLERDDAIDEPEEPIDLDWAYGPLHNLVKLVVGGYEDFVLLDAPGGLGKTYNIKNWLNEYWGDQGSDWVYQSGYTTAVELYKTLHAGRDKILFLDDMSGITSDTKCVNMLKAATDTEGEENWVEWNSSQVPEDDYGNELGKCFHFEGKIIMSFNDTPENRHWDALTSRGQDYDLDFTYDERLQIISEVAKNEELSPLPYSTRKETVEWIEGVTDPSVDVNIRTLEKVLNIREAFEDGAIPEWERTALEVFDLDYEKHLILQLHRDDEHESVEEQIDTYKEKTRKSRTQYYDKKGELKNRMGL